MNRKACLLVLAALTATCVACTQRTGKVHVTHPEVFRRERLVAQRVSDIQWLQDRYEDDKSQGFEGYSDTRRNNQFTSETSINLQDAAGFLFPDSEPSEPADPAPAPVTTAEGGTEDSTPSTGDDGTPTTTTGETTPAATPPPAQEFPSAVVVPTEAKSSPIDILKNRLAYRDAVSGAIRDRMLDDAHDADAMAMFDMSMQLNVRATGEEDGPLVVEMKLDDMEMHTASEVRRAYRGILKRMNLDYSRGYTELCAALEFESTENEDGVEEDHWYIDLDATEATLMAHALSYGIRLMDDRASKGPSLKAWLPESTDTERIATTQAICTWTRNCLLDPEKLRSLHSRTQGEGQESERERRREDLRTAWTLGSAWAMHYRFMSQVEVRWVRAVPPRALVREPVENHSQSIKHWVESTIGAGNGRSSSLSTRPLVQPTFFIDEEGAEEYEQQHSRCEKSRDHCSPSTCESGAGHFQEFYSWLECKFEDQKGHYVAQVGPRELSQNISRVSAKQDATDVILRLSYLLNNLGLESESRSIRKSLKNLQSIEKFPLIVGFGDGSDEFGWVLGPRFGQDSDGDEEHRHRTADHSVGIQAVVPLLSKKLSFTGQYSWYPAPRESQWSRLWTSEKTKPIRSAPIKKIDFDVPLDDIALEGMLRSSYTHLRGPDVYNVIGEIREGAKDQNLLILGQDLWRNPQVFLNGTKADRVEVLAHMRGLRATFDKFAISAPVNKGGTTEPALLTVITSEGEHEYGYTISVHRSKGVRPFVRGLLTKHLVEKDTISLEVDADLMPIGHAGMFLTLRPKGSNANWWMQEIRPELVAEGVTKLQFKLTKAPFGKSGDPAVQELEVGLMVRLEPGSDLKRVSIGDRLTFTYFKNNAAWLLSVKPDVLSAKKTTSGGKTHLELAKDTSLSLSFPNAESIRFQLDPKMGAPDLTAWSGKIKYVKADGKPSDWYLDVDPKALAAKKTEIAKLDKDQVNALLKKDGVLKQVKEGNYEITFILEHELNKKKLKPIKFSKKLKVNLKSEEKSKD